MLNRMTYSPIAPAERRAVTLRAKAGDSDAFMALLSDVLPNLRAGISRFCTGRMDRDDAESVALLAFTEALAAYDPARDREAVGVVSLLSQHVLEALRAAADEARSPISVPSRTLQRFWGIMRAADGDYRTARDLAPSFQMDARTFGDVYSAVFGTVSLTVAEQYVDSLDLGTGAIEDRVLADQALSVLGDDEAAITRLAYGFTTDRPESDGAIAEELGMSRSVVQRKRTRALGQMREAVGVA